MEVNVNELAKQAKNGDLEAFEALYDAFAQRIFKYIRLKIQNREEAEDVLQEVFIKAYNAMGKLKLEDLNFAAWLYRIASNTINDRFRKKYRTPDITPIDENFDIAGKVSLEKETELKSDIETMQAVLVKLSPLYKQVLELRFIQDFSISEVAKVLNKSHLSVRLLQYRALKKIQIILANQNNVQSKKI